VNKSATSSSHFTRSGILFLLSAPSGAGKTTLRDGLSLTPDFVYCPSCTSRPPRTGELEGEDYTFVTREEFLRLLQLDHFLEHAVVHGQYYGTPREPIVSLLRSGRDVLVDIDTQGARAIRSTADPFLRSSLADVFIMPPNLEELRRRLQRRASETPEQIEVRLESAAREMEVWREYRYTIISGSIEEDLVKFRAIMRAERYLSRRLVVTDSPQARLE
jgi:guanylate kinase